MVENSNLAYSEVFEILKLVDDEYVKRIPTKIIEFLEEERDKDYKPTIDIDITLDEKNLKRKTMVLLSIINYNYWCDSEEEKKEIQKELLSNNEAKELELKKLEERYNPDSIFKNREEHKQSTNGNNIELQLEESKENNFLKKLLKKILYFFKK